MNNNSFRLLLTSAGITNFKLAQELLNLSKLLIDDIKIGFIPTAANAEPGNKDWFYKQITDLNKFGFNWIGIVDFTVPDINWQIRLNNCNVVFISGGNTFYLLHQIKKFGFDKWILENSNKVFVGSSAGSIIFTPHIGIASVEPADDNFINISDLTALNIVDFEISPHSPEMITYESVKNYSGTTLKKVIGINDGTAILVNNNDIKIVGDKIFKTYLAGEELL